MKRVLATIIACVLMLGSMPLTAHAEASGTNLNSSFETRRFDFGGAGTAEGYIGVSAEDAYSASVGYGFANTSAVENVTASGTGALADAVRFKSEVPNHVFNVNLPKGVYKITVTTGDVQSTTITAEGRSQLFFLTGNNAVDSFTIPVTDGQLNIYASSGVGNNYSLSTLEIEQVSTDTITKPTIWVSGDSTVASYYNVSGDAARGWGQFLGDYVDGNQYEVRNISVSGVASADVKRSLFPTIEYYGKSGDILLLAVGINDYTSAYRANNADPYATTQRTQYQENMTEMVRRAAAKGMTIYLVLQQGELDDCGKNPLPDKKWFSNVLDEIAEAENVKVLDLFHPWLTFCAEKTKTVAQQYYYNNLHPNLSGAKELAKMVAAQLFTESIPGDTDKTDGTNAGGAAGDKDTGNGSQDINKDPDNGGQIIDKDPDDSHVVSDVFVDGSHVLSDMIALHGENTHPRIIMSEEKFASLRSHIGDGSVTARLLEDLRSEANRHVSEDPVSTYDADDEDHLLETSKRIQRRVAALALAYNIFGDEKYAERAYKELKAACNFPDWSPRHFLDTAEMCTAFAFGYDWLYDWLNPDQRKLLRTSMIEKGLKQVMQDYTDTPHDRKRTYKWYQDLEGDNWQLVCTGGTNLAALAIGDESDAKEIAAEVITYGYKRANSFVRRAYSNPDGTYIEGLGYWDYATYYLGLQSSALISATGTDYGLANYEGVKKSAEFVRYMSSNSPKSFSFGDDRESRNTGWAVFLWLGEYLNSPELSAIRLKNIGHDDDGFRYLDVLWIDESKQVGAGNNSATDWGAVGANNASFRNTWEETGIVTALHVGENNYKYHGHYDLGSFYLESNGSRFFTDLGNESYSLKDRQFSYRIKPEGHNTLVINPTEGTDQLEGANCLITEFGRGNEAYAVTDLTEAYGPNGANSVIRGLKMIKDKECVIVQDEISLKKAGEIYWFAHTKGQIKVASDGRSAVVTVDDDRLWVGLLSEGGKFSVMDAKPLSTSLSVSGATSNSDYRKLAVHLTNTKDTTISVVCIPLKKGETKPSWIPEMKAISEWSQDAYPDSIGANLAGYSLSLSDNIGVNFYMEFAESVMKDKNAKLVMQLPDGTGKEVFVNAAQQVNVNGKVYYAFDCRVAAKEMTGVIRAKIVLGDGTEGTQYEFTVQDYAKYILEHSSQYEKEVPVVKALLNYGAAAQQYFNHNTGRLANEILNETDKKAVSTPDLTSYSYVSPNATSKISYLGTSLLLESTIGFKCYFNSSTALTTDNISVKCGEKTVEASRIHIGKEGNAQYISVSGVSPAEYGTKYTVKALDLTVNNVSVYGYAAKAFSKDEESKALIDVLKNLYAYGEASARYSK